jgi:hypothetical protein
MLSLFAATGGATALAGVFAAWTTRFRRTNRRLPDPPRHRLTLRPKRENLI